MPDQPRKRGFGAMSKEQQLELARAGGRAAAERGAGHRFTPEEAREAGRKGACRDVERMREIGRIGGVASWAARQAQGPLRRGILPPVSVLPAPSEDEDWAVTQEIGTPLTGGSDAE